jgi:hypothetical protein
VAAGKAGQRNDALPISAKRHAGHVRTDQGDGNRERGIVVVREAGSLNQRQRVGIGEASVGPSLLVVVDARSGLPNPSSNNRDVNRILPIHAQHTDRTGKHIPNLNQHPV